MIDKEAIINKAIKLKHSGYNCAQSVALAIADLVNGNKEELAKITSGFGLGMGNMEATCGALVGAAIMVGLKSNGSGATPLNKKLSSNFKEKCRSLVCKEIKGVETKKVLCSCDDCVKNAVTVYLELMETNN